MEDVRHRHKEVLHSLLYTTRGTKTRIGVAKRREKERRGGRG